MKKLLNKITIHPITYLILLLALNEGLIKYVLIISIIIFLHEIGHIMLMYIFKRKISKIIILPFGGIINLDSYISTNIYEDLLISIAGILFQVIFGFLILKTNIPYKKEFLYYNNLIIIFNLLPIIPLDGEKILKNILELFLPFKKSLIFIIYISLITMFIIFYFNINLIYRNIIVIIFLIISLFKNFRNIPYYMNSFYLERMIHTFNFNQIKNINRVEDMYKNKENYMSNECEHTFIKRHFKLIKTPK